MAATILGSGTTPVTGTREITTSPTTTITYTFPSGFTNTNSAIALGGTLTGNADIDVPNALRFKVDADDASSTRLIIEDAALSLFSYADAGHSTASGFHQLALTNATMRMIANDGATTNRFIFEQSGNIEITDNTGSKGVIYSGDYSANFVDRSLIDRGFLEGGTAEGIMHVAQGNVLYSNAAQTTIVTVPADAVIWDVQVWVITGFTDSGTDLLDIGYTGTTNRFEAVLDISSTGFKTMTLTNVPSRVGATNITFQYTGQNGDAGAGSAMVYIHYSLH